MSGEAQMFRQKVPVQLRAALLRAVCAGCKSAFKTAKERGQSWFHDALPAHRRLDVEQLLEGVVLPPGFVSSVKETQTSTRYTQIESDSVVITAVTRTDDVDYVPPYRYRETLARSGNFAFAFADWLSAPPKEGAKLYALLIYGGSHASHIPSIARVVFPLPNGRLCDNDVDLLADHADIVDTYRDAPTIAADPQVHLIDLSKRKQAE